MINITLPDGSIKQVESGTTAMDIAMSISEGLSRKVLCINVNGEIWDLHRSITSDSKVKLHTWDDDKCKLVLYGSREGKPGNENKYDLSNVEIMKNNFIIYDKFKKKK